MAGLIDRLPHYQLDTDSVQFVKVPPSYHGVVDSGDLRHFLRSDETRRALARAYVEHTIRATGRAADGTSISTTTIWTGWECLGCNQALRTAEEAHRHQIDAVIRVLTGETPE
jgi:hypothetical protein